MTAESALLIAIDRVLVPALLIAQFVRSALVAHAAPRPLPRQAGQAGFWAGAGFTVLTIPTIMRLADLQWTGLTLPIWALALVLAPVIAKILWLEATTTSQSDPWFAGLVTTALASGSGIALVLTLSIEQLQAPIRSSVLGALFLVLMAAVLHPEKIFRKKRPPVLYE